MASNKSSPAIGDMDTKPLEDGPKPAEFNCSSTENSQLPLQQSSAQVEVETFSEAGKKGDDADHGNRFQSKLLMLYALRAINLGYQFYLGTELPDVGDKFDDLIFHYKEKNEKNYRQQYLQAKHRLNENDPKYQITANDLLDENDGDFSLLKYFQSFVKIRGKGNDIEHCIICTNVEFDHMDITNNGITLECLDEKNWPKLLHCNGTKNDQACYKLKDTGIFKTTLFENILNCVTDFTDEEMTILFKNCNEVVVNEKPFNENTADEMKKFFTDSAQYQDQVEKTLIEKMFNDSKNTLSIRNWIVNCTDKERKRLFQNCTEKVNGKPFNEHTAGDMKNFLIDSAQYQNQVEKTLIEAVFNDPQNTSSIQNWIVKSSGKELKRLFKNCTEVVDGKPFNEHTADEMKNFFIQNRNQVVKKLLEIVLGDFLDKLKFAVKTPNEDELNDILTKEVVKHFKLSNSALQSAHFMNEIANWFKRTDKKHHWLTAKEAEDILKTNAAYIKVIELTALSLDYQRQLKQIKTESENSELEFEDTVINQWTAMLKSFWESQEEIKHLSSKTPKLTAVKVISAIKCLPEFPNKDDYLVISSKRFKENQTEMKESLKANINNGHRLLVVVNEEAENPLEDMFYLEFIPETTKRKVIVISNQNGRKESYRDTINYGQLIEKTKKVLRERQVSFQGKDFTLNDLIDMKQVDKVLDSKLIENLLQMAEQEKIVVPSFNKSSFGKYIERKLKFPKNDQLLRNLAVIEEKPDRKINEQQTQQAASKKMNEEIEIDLNGKFKWKTENDKRKKDIWKELKILLEQNNSSDLSLLSTVNDQELFNGSNKELSTRIIITDVAGTGKSTILSHYYEEIKKVNLDKLVIKISLMNYSKALMNEKNIDEFLINNVVDKNSFAQSLLRHRLETGDRITLMLDGFNEIDNECQSKVVELVKNLNESIPLYITTRPHLADQLQFELSQLAYSLDRFTKKDQINYLAFVWKEYLKEVHYNEETINKFAKDLTDRVSAIDLIKRVSETLKDKEKEFIGIPLQCQILAECFQSKIKDEIIRKPKTNDLSHLIPSLQSGQQLDLFSLLKLRIEDMRLLFERKIYVNYTGNHIANLILKKTIRKTEQHLRNLAIKTIVGEKNNFISISPSSGEFQSEFENENEEKSLNESGIRFGLLNRGNNESEVQFLHRTYAEYLVAEFIFNGFHFDEEKHNNLLENESARKWIIKEMLVEDNYEGVRVFFDSMLKEILNEDWKNRIQNLDLPNRLQEFVCLVIEDNRWSLKNVLEERNYNIVLLIFCCLEAALHKPSPKITEKLQNFKMLGEKLLFPSSVTAFCIQSDELTQQLLKIATFIYSSDSDLTDFLKEAVIEYLDRKDFLKAGIEKMLTILQGMGRINVADEISRFLRTRESNKLQQNENTIIRSSSEEMSLEGLPIEDEDGHRICQMASKRPYLKIGGDLTEPPVDGTKPPFNCPNENNSSPSQTPLAQVENETPPAAGKKMPDDARHGNRFQSKLLMLYAVRAINFGYQFYLGTELSVGDKFDDLIFHFKDENDVTFRQQYLHVNHRLNENDPTNQIKATHLLDVKKGDFSLLKYFQSYVKIRGKGNEIENCIICTNVDFNYKDITNNGITLKRVDELNWPKLLDCTNFKPQQSCYKLKDSGNFKMSSSGNLLNCVTKCTGEEMKNLFQNCTEVVNGKPFNENTADEMSNFFINYQNQIQVVKKLIEIVFDDFLDKLMFAVKTPNEDELNSILAKEVGKYFKLSNSALQSAHFMNEMVNWFKLPDEKHHWLKPKEAEEILKANTKKHIKMIEIISFSLDYQKQLKQIKTSENYELEFEDTTINQLTSMLQLFWDSQEKIKHLSSKTPKLTAVKLFSAIKKLPEFHKKDNYLVISSKRLREKKHKIKKSMKVIGNNLLVVVDEDAKNPLEDDSFYKKLIPENKKKKVIVISSQNFTKESYDEDTITYEQLNENTKKMLRERQVSFQGNDLTLNDLIDMKQVDKVLDSQLIEYLLQMAWDDQIVISSFITPNFEKSLYVERKLKFPSKELLNKLADIEENSDKKVDEQMKSENNKINEEIEIDQNRKIKWKTEDNNRKLDIWKELKVLLEQNNSSVRLYSIVSERGLIDTSNKRIIITGVAGTGKSTILSHYYEVIKKDKSDNLVIKISLNSFSKILKNTNNINEFLINNVVDQNSFARSLMKHRLETGDRIILMLDGFDEIDSECQRKVVELVKTLNESIPLYITTRSHLADKLQFELSQLAYSLDKLTEDDQINFLTSIWKEYLIKDGVSINDKKIETFSRQLIDQVNRTLKDKEKEFIGIPLQCRILAECFQSKFKDQIDMKTDSDHDFLLDEDQQFDLANLYKLMIEEKRRVLREEKIKVNFGQSHIVDNSIDNNILKTEKNLRKLAVQTVVHQQKHVAILIPSGVVQSESERKKEEKELNENGIRFGLLGGSGENGIEFLHKTYAEYFLADFIFNGFLLDDQRHNNLLVNESVREWITKEMLVKDNYKGVRVFFNSMLKELFNEEWKNRIAAHDLPNRLQQFVFCGPFIVLRKAFDEMNSNIILFIFDCLDVTFSQTPSKISTLILGIISHNKSPNMFQQSVDVFTRLLHYFDKDHESKKEITEKLCKCLQVKVKQLKSENVKRFLNFIYDNQKQTETIKNDDTFINIAIDLIYNKCKEIGQQVLKIVTTIYSKDDYFYDNLNYLMKKATKNYIKQEDWEFNPIEKTIITLKENRQEKVAAELSRFVLFIKFEEFKKEENANIRLWLEEIGMTGLHGAAFRGDLKSIENEIGCSLENPKKCSKEERNSVLQLLAMKDIVLENLHKFSCDYDGEWNENDVCTPFYVSAVYGHEEIVRKICNFVVAETVEIDDQKEFLQAVLNKTLLTLNNNVMLKMILNSVKEIRDQNALVKLLYSWMTRYHLSKKAVETVVSVFKKDNDYRDLNDVFFHGRGTLQKLEHVEFDVLQEMIAVEGGFDKWIKRLIDTDLKQAFIVLSSDGFLIKLNQTNQIPKLIDILITKRTTYKRSTSYWSDRFEWQRKVMMNMRSFQQQSSSPTNIIDFLSAISKIAGEDDLKKLWLYRDDNNFLIIFLLLPTGKDKFNEMLSNLPRNHKNEIENLWKEENVFNHFLSSQMFDKQMCDKQKIEAIEYASENGYDFNMNHLMKKAFVSYINDNTFEFSRIEKTLRNLQDLGQDDIVAQLSRYILFRTPKTLEDEDDIRISLEKMGMRGLHGAAFQGDLNLIEIGIGCSLNPETCSEVKKNSILQLLVNENEDDVSPLHVAAAKGHEHICRKIFLFFNPNEAIKELIHKTLLDAIKNNNVVTFKTILKSVKAVWGQNTLIQLLKPIIPDRFYFWSKSMVKTLASIVVQSNGFQGLNDVFFHDKSTLQKLQHVECDILQEMIAAEGGLDNWIKRLIRYDKAFDVLSSNGFLVKFNQMNQIQKLVDILITKRPTERGATSCYWSDFLKLSHECRIKDFLATISKVAEEDDLKSLLFSRDDTNIVFLFYYLIWRDKSYFNYIITGLPENLKQKIEDLLKEETPQVIDSLFSSPEFLESLELEQQWNAIEFCLKNGNQEQLLKISQVVKVDLLEKVLEKIAETSWGREICKKFAELLSKTIFNYNHLIEIYTRREKEEERRQRKWR